MTKGVPTTVQMAWMKIAKGVGTPIDIDVVDKFFKMFETEPVIIVEREPLALGKWTYNGVNLTIVEGYMLTSDFDRVNNITNAIKKAGGNCPCVPSTLWGQNTLCPCQYYREGNGCHCGLYIKE